MDLDKEENLQIILYISVYITVSEFPVIHFLPFQLMILAITFRSPSPPA